ncbi:MAG: hypothetical protein LBG76_08575 [Treponema sp.]|jgi:DNA-binding CsgD family transcriptional regulator|nr:hypothetical protein [Treponema sp.]
MNNVLGSKPKVSFPRREDLSGIKAHCPLLWRITAVIIFFLWAIVFLFTLYVHLDTQNASGLGSDQLRNGMSMPVFAVSGGATLIVLAVLIVYPMSFFLWAGLCCFWGLALLWESGDILGIFLYGLGVIFAYKRDFFNTFLKAKIFLSIVLPLAAIGAQFLDGMYLPLITILRFSFLAMAAGAAVILLFMPDFSGFIKKLSENQQEPDAIEHSEEDASRLFLKLSDRDKSILNSILENQKYVNIAHAMNMSEPTLKRQLKRIFKLLEVSNREMFEEKYGEISF